jgi:hypothetical protein
MRRELLFVKRFVVEVPHDRGVTKQRSVMVQIVDGDNAQLAASRQ